MLAWNTNKHKVWSGSMQGLWTCRKDVSMPLKIEESTSFQKLVSFLMPRSWESLHLSPELPTGSSHQKIFNVPVRTSHALQQVSIAVGWLHSLEIIQNAPISPQCTDLHRSAGINWLQREPAVCSPRGAGCQVPFPEKGSDRHVTHSNPQSSPSFIFQQWPYREKIKSDYSTGKKKRAWSLAAWYALNLFLRVHIKLCTLKEVLVLNNTEYFILPVL